MKFPLGIYIIPSRFYAMVIPNPHFSLSDQVLCALLLKLFIWLGYLCCSHSTSPSPLATPLYLIMAASLSEGEPMRDIFSTKLIVTMTGSTGT